MQQLVIYQLDPANEAPFHELFRTVTQRVMLRLGFVSEAIWTRIREQHGPSVTEITNRLLTATDSSPEYLRGPPRKMEASISVLPVTTDRA